MSQRSDHREREWTRPGRCRDVGGGQDGGWEGTGGRERLAQGWSLGAEGLSQRPVPAQVACVRKGQKLNWSSVKGHSLTDQWRQKEQLIFYGAKKGGSVSSLEKQGGRPRLGKSSSLQ